MTFKDVAGQDAAVSELREISQFLADPERFAAVGAQVPKGVLIYGPPGCGKTLLARALAGEAGASFYSISGSDFVELYVGVGAARVRDLFREARESAPSIVFIDELDAIGRRRAGGSDGALATGSRDEQDQALNGMLAEMDGFSPSAGIIVVGATNRPDVLDPALLRPGRFDRSIGLETPDERGRLAILEVHAQGKPLASDLDLGAIAHRASPAATPSGWPVLHVSGGNRAKERGSHHRHHHADCHSIAGRRCACVRVEPGRSLDRVRGDPEHPV